jgi:hypothetical protein
VTAVPLTAARRVADAILYEGYLLYPYRASSAKNQVRWQFGVLGPPGAAEAGVGEPGDLSTELLVEAQPDGRLDVVVRFLQVQSRAVERPDGDVWMPVDELVVGGTRWIPYSEAVAREVPLLDLPLEDQRELSVAVPGGAEVEDLLEDGRLVGRLVRTRRPLQGALTLTTRPGVDPRVVVVGLRLENRTPWAPHSIPGWSDRDVAARSSFVGTHLLVTARRARLLSLLDGPDWAAADAATCAQERCWPVLVADDEGGDAVLVSPIILGDHPTIAPESAGDLFDATEIDEILTLRILTLTESEREEARGTDPRAAAILDRCDALSPADLDRMHGARRGSPGLGEPALDIPTWDEEGLNGNAQPEKDAVLIAGIPVARGTRVLLRPSRPADAQDIFLAGQTAVVTRVFGDLDGETHVAVVLEDDPGADLYDTTGRFYYFHPDELEPLASPGGAP